MSPVITNPSGRSREIASTQRSHAGMGAWLRCGSVVQTSRIAVGLGGCGRRGRFGESFRLVGLLPRERVPFAAEVAAGGRGPEDRTTQLQVFDDPGRVEREVLTDQ